MADTALDPAADLDALVEADNSASDLDTFGELDLNDPERTTVTDADITDAVPSAEPGEGADEDAQPEAAEPEDALADAVPFTYTVDGQDKAFDGIREFKGPDGQSQGAVIPPESLQSVRDRLQRADYLEANDRARYEKMREYETVSVQTPSGQTLTGMDAVQHYAAEHAKLTAAVQVMASVLEDPEKLAALYGDPRELQLLARELGLSARDAEAKARQQFQGRTQEVRQQETAQQDRADVTTKSITGSVQHWASQFPSLTPDDTARAVQYFSRLGSSLVRPATPDEAKAAGVKPGDLVIDHPVIYEWLKDRAEMRQAATKSTTVASKAAQENATRLAAAARPKARPAAKPVTPEKPRDKTEEWQAQKLRMMAGQFSTED